MQSDARAWWTGRAVDGQGVVNAGVRRSSLRPHAHVSSLRVNLMCRELDVPWKVVVVVIVGERSTPNPEVEHRAHPVRYDVDESALTRALLTTALTRPRRVRALTFGAASRAGDLVAHRSRSAGVHEGPSVLYD